MCKKILPFWGWACASTEVKHVSGAFSETISRIQFAKVDGVGLLMMPYPNRSYLERWIDKEMPVSLRRICDLLRVIAVCAWSSLAHSCILISLLLNFLTVHQRKWIPPAALIVRTWTTEKLGRDRTFRQKKWKRAERRERPEIHLTTQVFGSDVRWKIMRTLSSKLVSTASIN